MLHPRGGCALEEWTGGDEYVETERDFNNLTDSDSLFLQLCFLPGAQAQNFISHLEGLEDLVQLTTLHLRDNKLETLDGFSRSMKCLQYLNLRWVLPWSALALETPLECPCGQWDCSPQSMSSWLLWRH